MGKAASTKDSPCKEGKRVQVTKWVCRKGRKGQGKGRPLKNHTCMYGRLASGICKKKPRGKGSSAVLIQKMFRGKIGRQVGSLAKEAGGLRAIIAKQAPAVAKARKKRNTAPAGFVPRSSGRSK